jgi:soluble lytic murein transglycosylase-like protein
VIGLPFIRFLTPLLVAIAATLALLPVQAAAYTVQPGETLWQISKRTGVSVERLARDNRLADANLIYAGQDLKVAAGPPATSQAEARALLVDAAYHHGLRISFVLAVSYWESGWNQQMVSKDGAIGLMQILPATESWAAPRLLGRHLDLRDARDNAELGAALLRHYLEEFDDPKLALAAYYQGPTAVHRYGIYPSSRRYVDGIWALRNRFEAST